jgi:TonB family protein
VLSAALARQPPDQHRVGDVSAEKVAVETFTDPRPNKLVKPGYPAFQSTEGWVIVSAMVDPQGKAFEVGVERSTGNKDFERVAVEAMGQATFYPGTIGGKPIESVIEGKYVFTIPNYTPGARLHFIDAYKSLHSAVKANDHAAADAAIQKLQVTTLYEDTYYWLAQYEYAALWGNESQQEIALWRTIGGDEYLRPEERRTILLTNFKLQVRKHDYFQALKMWDSLRAAGVDREITAKIKPILDQIEQIRTGPSSYEMSGIIGEDGDWGVHLFKRHFRADVAEGVISKVKLRCSKGFVSFAFDPNLQYEVQDKYGDCRLSVEGTPGTRFQLFQS